MVPIGPWKSGWTSRGSAPNPGRTSPLSRVVCPVLFSEPGFLFHAEFFQVDFQAVVFFFEKKLGQSVDK